MLPAGDQDEVELVPPHPGHQQAASSVLYTQKLNKLRGLSPQANYTDRAAAAGWRS